MKDYKITKATEKEILEKLKWKYLNYLGYEKGNFFRNIINSYRRWLNL